MKTTNPRVHKYYLQSIFLKFIVHTTAKLIFKTLLSFSQKLPYAIPKLSSSHSYVYPLRFSSYTSYPISFTPKMNSHITISLLQSSLHLHATSASLPVAR